MSDIAPLLAVMRALRDPEQGCPWDLQQSFASISPFTIEEAYEVAEAIAQDDMPALCDELGDLLFQVAFHAQLAKERGAFDFSDVVNAIVDKMVRRHPHVFSSVTVDGVDAQSEAWEEIKAKERKHSGFADASLFDAVSRGAPATTRALKLQRKAMQLGLDWPDMQGVLRALDEERQELNESLVHENKQRAEEELGDLLFTCVNVARHADIDCDQALRRANGKFEWRCRHVESQLAQGNLDSDTLTEDELDEMWRRAKAAWRERERN